MTPARSKFIPEIERYHLKDQPPELFDKNQGQQQQVMSPQKKRVVLAVVGAILLVVALFPVRLTVRGTARVVPVTTLTIEALTVGELQEVYRGEGDIVEMGDVLARIRNGDYESELAQSLKELEVISKQMEQLQQRRDHLSQMLERNEALHEEKVIAITELEQTQLDHSQTLLELDIKAKKLESLRLRIAFLRDELEHSLVRAPITGTILGNIRNKTGKWLSKGTELCQIFDSSDMLLEVPVYESEVQYVRIGGEVLADFHAFGGKRYTGKVQDIRPVAWEKLEKVWVKENVINVLVKTDGIPGGLKPGMSADVQILGDRTILSRKIARKLGL
jgi:RND family efflux transporter MFP subunit